MARYPFHLITTDRSHDNLKAIISLHTQGLHGQETAILRQELDSLIRACYLLTITDPNERLRLIDDTLNGVKWIINGKPLTDRKMANIARQYNHWASELYDFGNSFTHLTNYHDFKNTDPLLRLDANRKAVIRHYLNTYHFFPNGGAVTINNVIPFIPRVAQKVSDNLNSFLDDLENNGVH